MPKRVFVTKQQYEAILKWEDEGGATVEIEYVIIDESERDASLAT